MKLLLQTVFAISVFASSSFAAVSAPHSADERKTASQHFDVERFTSAAFRCFDDNEKLFRTEHKAEPSPEQREEWVDVCANTPDGN